MPKPPPMPPTGGPAFGDHWAERVLVWLSALSFYACSVMYAWAVR